MEFTEEQVTELGLTEDNTTKVSVFFEEQIANTKKEYDGIANANAEKILEGASKKIFSDTGIERQQSEKVGDYITRAWDEHNVSKLTELEQKKTDYDDKIKNFKGSNETKNELLKAKEDNDKLLQKFADYDILKEKADKFEPLFSDFSNMKLDMSFNKTKPNFPQEANKYEVDAKWGEFKNNILSKYNIELVDGEPMAIDKENIHKQVKLKDLVAKDENIVSLLNGRQQSGTGAKPATFVDIQGVPFKVPENASAEVRTAKIKEYLASEGISVTSPNYSQKFAEYNSAILKK
ncbi:MAG: hypothetical protein HQ490_01865 [Lutibacter sp.]|nr:hypothetical protein [Lutibacter sp.]